MILNYQSLGSFFETNETLVFDDNVLKYINQKLMIKTFERIVNKTGK